MTYPVIIQINGLDDFMVLKEHYKIDNRYNPSLPYFYYQPKCCFFMGKIDCQFFLPFATIITFEEWKLIQAVQ